MASRPVTALRIGRWAGVAVCAGLLLAALGPFGTYLRGGPVRLGLYWVGAMLLGLLLYGMAYWTVSRSRLPRALGWWASLIAASLLASLPESLATRAGAAWLWPEVSPLRVPLGVWFAQTAMIGLLATAGAALLMRRATSRDGQAARPSQDAAEAPLGSEVLALQMEDHYVRVHRATGSELILMPLGRAVERVAAEGLRTHRSWWVAKQAVVAVEGDARSMRLRLSNGVVAPVARSAVIRLKQAGWVDRAE
jgi:hypothetical protein